MNDDKKLMLEALGNVVDRNRDKREKNYYAKKAGPDTSQNLTKGDLDKEVLRVKSDASGIIPPEERTVVGKTSKIDTVGQVQPQTTGVDFAKKQADLNMKQQLKSSFKAAADAGDKDMMNKLRQIAGKMQKGASKGLKALPIVGTLAGMAGAVSSNDASAGIPILDTADSVGMSASAEDQMLAETQAKIDYENSQAKRDKQAALAKLLKLRK
jgi:hypothetical protein